MKNRLVSLFMGFIFLNLVLEVLRFSGKTYLDFQTSSEVQKQETLKTLRDKLSCSGQKASEAKQTISFLNRAQQTYFAEKHKFARYTHELGGLLPSENYYYFISNTNTGTFAYAIPRENVTDKVCFGLLQWDKVPLYAIVGGVFPVRLPQSQQLSTLAVTCIANKPGIQTLNPPTLKDNQPYCPANSRLLNL